MSNIVAKPDLDKMDRLVQTVMNKHHDVLKKFRVTWIKDYDVEGYFLGWVPQAELDFKDVSDYEEDLSKWAAKKSTRH